MDRKEFRSIEADHGSRGPIARALLKSRMAMSRETPLEQFRSACGLAAPLALAAEDAHSPDSPPLTFHCPGPFLLIGRGPNDDFLLDHPQVSRRHAYVQAVAGRVVCIDLKSRTSTFWDDQPEPRPWGWLNAGRSIRIGPYRIQRTDRHPDEPAHGDLDDPFSRSVGGEAGADALPRAALELPIRVGGVAPTWEMGSLLAVVGRADDCQLTLADDSVSRTHACLVRTPLGTWVVDLGAREGVHVNGTRVRWAWLADGDVVRFGLFTMVLRYDYQPLAIVREDVPLDAGAFPAESPGDRRSGRLASSVERGTELAIRPKPRPPGLRRASAPPQVFSSAAPPAVNEAAWEPAFGPGPASYAVWQQQMQLMETFHNDMAMMVQMFVAMHREFQGSVREELARVQQLTKELSRLNARLNQIPERAGGSPTPEAARPEAKARPVPRQVQPGSQASPRADADRSTDATAGPQHKKRKDEPRRAARSPSVSADREEPASARTPRMESSEMYADLTRRITQLQTERRGYWQRILKAING
jgi:pSer/pThr/pTyr-binding forkhead associated (FHA) protein